MSFEHTFMAGYYFGIICTAALWIFDSYIRRGKVK